MHQKSIISKFLPVLSALFLSFAILCALPPSPLERAAVITLAQTELVLYTGKFVTSTAPTVINWIKVDAYSIEPALPKGLVFDPALGVFSGTPDSCTSRRQYAITATNEWGSSIATFNAKVLLSRPDSVYTTSVTPSSVRILWPRVRGADKYSVFRSSGALLNFSLLQTTRDTTILDIAVAVGLTYQYYVIALSSATDSAAPSDTITITIPLSHAVPSVQNDSYTMVQDSTLMLLSPGVLVNDVGAADSLQAILVDTVKHGTLLLQKNGAFNYVPSPGFFGIDTFSYKIINKYHEESATKALGIITVYKKNVVPTFTLTVSSDGHGVITPTTPVQKTSGVDIAITAAPSVGYAFSKWQKTSGSCAITDTASATTNVKLTSGDATIQAVFTRIPYSITLVSSPNGTIVPNVSNLSVLYYGDVVNLKARFANGYYFGGWNTDTTGSDTSLTITITKNMRIGATFALVGSLALSTSGGSNGTVTRLPDSASYHFGTQVLLTAAPVSATSGYVFSSWANDTTGSTNPLSVIMNKSKTISAVFVLKKYTLTASSGGNGSVTPTLPLAVVHGVDTPITATPSSSSYKFSKWHCDSGSVAFVDSFSATTKVKLISGNAKISALFVANTFTLTVQSDGHASSVTPSTATSLQYNVAQAISALPAVGYNFYRWRVVSGTASITDTTLASTSVKLSSGDATIQAVFNIKKYALAITALNGTVPTSPTSGPFDSNTVVTLTPTPATNYRFVNWTGGDVVSGTNPAQITMNSAKSVTANFIRQFTLTVNANPSNIGATVYGGGVVDSLVAAPISAASAPSGYKFTGWTVALGTATIAPSANQSTDVKISTNATITANFALIPAALITSQPTEVSGDVGDTVQLFVRASSATPMMFQWYKDNNAMLGKTDSVLILNNLQKSDSGSYKVNISNGSLSPKASDAVAAKVVYVKSVSMGGDVNSRGEEFQTIIIKSDKSIWACGYNSGGELGVSGATRNSTVSIPAQMSISLPVKDAAAGWLHSLMITEDNRLWGCGNFSMLGSQPVPVQISSLPNVSKVVSGAGRSYALGSDGVTLYECSGDSAFLKPKVISSYGSITALASSGWSLLFARSGNSLVVSGSNYGGELGTGNHDDVSTPTQLVWPLGGRSIRAIATSKNSHSMIVCSDGTLWGCGSNRNGMLGTPTTNPDTSLFILIPLPNGKTAKDVALGNQFSLVLTTDGEVLGCGAPLGLGVPATSNITAFEKVMLAPEIGSVASIAAFGSSSMVIGTDGRLWSTGGNIRGQLGDGTQVTRNTPVLIRW